MLIGISFYFIYFFTIFVHFSGYNALSNGAKVIIKNVYESQTDSDVFFDSGLDIQSVN